MSQRDFSEVSANIFINDYVIAACNIGIGPQSDWYKGRQLNCLAKLRKYLWDKRLLYFACCCKNVSINYTSFLKCFLIAFICARTTDCTAIWRMVHNLLKRGSRANELLFYFCIIIIYLWKKNCKKKQQKKNKFLVARKNKQ